jgi:hypothetical protein
VFCVQRKIIRLMASVKRRAPCWDFRNFVLFHYIANFHIIIIIIIIIVVVVISGKPDFFFQKDSDIHSINRRYRCNIHVPTTNLGKYQKGAYCTRIKLFNNLSPTIKCSNHGTKLLMQALKGYLISHSYAVDESVLIKKF